MEGAAVPGQSAKIEPSNDGLESSFLSFLTDELVFGSEALDPATLEAVCQVAGNNGQGAAQAASGSAARPLLAAQPAAQALPGPTVKRPLEDGGCSDSDDDEESGRGEKASTKRSKGGEMSAAATKKACREKARREKLNERFSDLARLIDPSGEPKTDKSTILTDAIKFVQQITVENHQLRQLNKFLEERVGTLERERGQQLYQQSLMMTSMGQGQMMQAGQAMLVSAPPSMLANPLPAAMPGPQLGHPLQASAAMASSSGALLSAASLPTAPTPPLPSLPHQHQQQAAAAAAAAAGGMMAQAQGAGLVAGMGAPPGMAAAAALQGLSGLPGGMCSAAAGGVAVNVGAGPGPSKPILVNTMPGAAAYPGMGYWLPPQMTDSMQDSLLRPPAA